MNRAVPSSAASYQSRRITRKPTEIPATARIVPVPPRMEPRSVHVFRVAVRCSSSHRSTLPSQPTIRGETDDLVMMYPIATSTMVSTTEPATESVAATAAGCQV